jgi:hypothetical protein
MKWISALCYRFTAFWLLLMCGEAMVNDPQHSTVGATIAVAGVISFFWTVANMTERDTER